MYFKTMYVFLVLLLTMNSAVAEKISVKFAYVGDPDHAALLGATQGIEESNLQGEFLNQTYSLDTLTEEEAATRDFADYIAVLSAGTAETLNTLSERLPATPVFNLVLADDALRMACRKNQLHVIPGKKMQVDAEAQWLQKQPDSNATAQAWHPDFVKFAARDLNKRFKKSHQVSMDDHAWAGWAAVKMTSNAVARTNHADPAAMLTHLRSDQLAFDGQKGTGMNFRETGQLKQIMLLVENDSIVAEAPIRGVAKPSTLDSLGNLDCAK